MRNLDSSNVSINRLAWNALDAFGSELQSKNISLETDLSELEAKINVSLVSKAIVAMIENAIEAMPQGGHMSVTLIDAQHQWELEVADTSGVGARWMEADVKVADPQTTQLPAVVAIEKNEYLKKAREAAQMQGGDLQSWECPQGGNAHVLVIPTKRTFRKSA